MESAEKLLVVEHLVKEYKGRANMFEKKPPSVRAVDVVSFYVGKGATFGIVGESGCGKTTLGKCLVRLHMPDSGKMFFNIGDMKDLLALDKKESFLLRRRVQIIFQDPYASLNPMHNIFEAFDEPLRIHGLGDSQKRKEIIAKMLEAVNLQPDYMYRYPHEFSGGQRQRICIAKALAMNPELIICDEPVSRAGCFRTGADPEFDA
jgi:ABC-type oligopeptide transport system ATPase subunit